MLAKKEKIIIRVLSKTDEGGKRGKTLESKEKRLKEGRGGGKRNYYVHGRRRKLY